MRKDFLEPVLWQKKCSKFRKIWEKNLQLRSLKSLSRTSSGYTCQINIRLRRHLTRSLKHVKTDISPPKTGSKSASLWFWSFYRRVLNWILFLKIYHPERQLRSNFIWKAAKWGQFLGKVENLNSEYMMPKRQPRLLVPKIVCSNCNFRSDFKVNKFEK